MTNKARGFLYTHFKEKEVRKIYEIYIDVIMIKCLMESAVLTLCVLIGMNKKIVWNRIMTGSICNTIGNMIFLVYCPRNMICIFFILLGNGTICALLGMKNHSYKELLYAICFYHFFSSMHICLSMLAVCFHGKEMLSVKIICLLSSAYIISKRNNGDMINMYYTVEVYVCGKKFRVQAFLDTGNMLRDKKTNKMVCIVEESAIESILCDIKEYEYLPYKTVGQEAGLMRIVEADCLSITKEDKTKKIYGVLLGVYEGKFTSNNRFQMILHGECLKGRKNNGSILENIFTKGCKRKSA